MPASRGTRRRWSAARPRVETPRPTRMPDRTGAPRLTPTGSNTQTDRSPLGPRRCSAAAARRPGMPGCFTWNRRQFPGGWRTSDPDVRPRLSEVRTARCSTAGSSIRAPTSRQVHVELCRCFTAGAVDPGARTGWLFHVEPEAVFRRTAPQIRTPGPDVSRRTAAVLRDRFSSIRAPTTHQVAPGTVSVFHDWRCGLGRPDGLVVSRGTGGSVSWSILVDPEAHSPARVHVDPRRSSLLSPGRSGCPEGPDVSRGTVPVLHGRGASEPDAG